MASMNGISIKGLQKFLGHEGEPLFQGTLYLNGKKLGFWSQDSHGGADNFMFEGGWKQELAVDNAVKAMYPEKAIHGKARDGRDYVIEYGLEFLLTDLLELMDDEKAFKKAVKSGYAGIMVATDGVHVTAWQLPETYTALSDEALMAKMGPALNNAMQSFFPEDDFRKHSIKVYRSLKDFTVGFPLRLNEKSVDELLADSTARSKGADAGEKHKSDVDKEI